MPHDVQYCTIRLSANRILIWLNLDAQQIRIFLCGKLVLGNILEHQLVIKKVQLLSGSTLYIKLLPHIERRISLAKSPGGVDRD